MAAVKPINRQLDPAILATMEEPITVNVSRVVSGARTPLMLPIKESTDGMSYGPGEGWEKIHVQMLEGWLVTDFSGGGLYNIKIVDNKGLTFEWQPFFDPKQFAPRVPYTMQSATSGHAPVYQQPMQSTSPPLEVVWPPRGIDTGIPLATPIPQATM